MSFDQADIAAFEAKWDRFMKALFDALSEVAMEYAEKMWQTARDMVPVDSGALRGTIRTDLVVAARTITALVLAGDLDEVRYQWFVELGTFRTLAQPYMSPAWEAHWQSYINASVKAVMDIIRDFSNEKL